MPLDPNEPDFPRPLTDALRTAYTHRPEIPSRIDTAILSAARAKSDHRRRLRLLVRWGGGIAAGLAAAIVLAVTLHRPATPSKPIARGDVNSDGQVNMIDALALAKRLAAGDKLDPTSDVNRDGQITQADVDALATAAVSLKQNGLARRALPKLNDLGLDRPLAQATPVNSASADGILGRRAASFSSSAIRPVVPPAEADPAKATKMEVRQ
jgi:hypothetical protein